MEMKNKKQTPKDFKLPRYTEIPNTGLYLEQVSQYMNDILSPLGCATITSSMISNYVKKGLITSPVKKLYYADQISYLFAVSIMKLVLPMENIQKLFDMQKEVYSTPVAYDYFCTELENVLQYVYEEKEQMDEIGSSSTQIKTMLRNTIISAAHIIHLNECFKNLDSQKLNIE